MEVTDESDGWQVLESAMEFAGHVISVRRDLVRSAEGDTFSREVVVHPGAVAVVAVDDASRVLVVRQYRHPTGQRLVELPAGLLDVHGEEPLAAARRELAEEGLVEATEWSPLVDVLPSPGMTSELVRVYLATGISHLEGVPGFVARHEEATMTREWVPLDDLVTAVLERRARNGILAAGCLALYAARARSSGQAAAAQENRPG
jgi:ADP-ribose pyrophosphatase